MLPAIDIPITLPFELPVLLHPPLVHFAIVLPVVILLLEFVNLFMRKRAVSVVSLSLLTLLVIVLFGAFFTGKVDGSEAFDAMTGDAREILKEHKLLGTYLAYASLVLLFLKFLNVTKSGTLKVLYMLALIGFVFATLHQGKEGGELVFKHGTNVEALADMDDKAFDLQEELDELTEELDELKASAEEEETEAPEAEKKEETVEETEEKKELETEKEDSNETK
ncbi:MAG TPA: hypothetical protein EYH01_05400 [Campylobacterales bacterium]|nr:hypothetical protein [Campylobacterales bacterium]